VAGTAAVAAPRREAIDAGEALLARGGNAVDAAVGAAVVLFAVEPYMTGPGGVGELTYVDRDGIAHVVDAGARAPANASDSMYRVVGEATGLYAWPEVEAAANTIGPLAVTAPRIVAGLHEAHKRFGRLSWEEVLEPAIELAAEGWDLDFFTCAVLVQEMATLAHDSLARKLFYPDGLPLPPPISGTYTQIKNEQLASTLTRIAHSGPEALTSGPLATSVLEVAGKPHGVLAEDDVAEASMNVLSGIEPLTCFRGWSIFGSPLPSGALSVAQILGILEAAGPPDCAADSPDRYRRLAIASHAAFTDRLARLSGGDTPETARALLTEEHLARGAAAVQRGSIPANHPGGPTQPVLTATTHVSVVDSEGAAVALTHTLLSLFGARVGVVAGGFFLNNGMLWFDPRPGHPNSIRPGARALSAMSPIVAVSPDGSRRLAVGALGARRIIPAVVQIVQNVIDYEMTLDAAVNWPRVHTDSISTEVDERLPEEVFSALRGAGFVPERGHYGPTSLTSARAAAVAIDCVTGARDVGIDRRAEACWRFGAADAVSAGHPTPSSDAS
jgi:gamma-glutamyltranspeptidase/glutathione hydrolase